jgi:hypothetical protein
LDRIVIGKHLLARFAEGADHINYFYPSIHGNSLFRGNYSGV